MNYPYSQHAPCPPLAPKSERTQHTTANYSAAHLDRGLDFAVDDLAEALEDGISTRSCLHISKLVLTRAVVDNQHVTLDIILNEAPAQLVVLGATLEMGMLSKRLGTLIVFIQDSRFHLKESELVGKFARIRNFGSARTDADELRLSC